MPSNNKGLKRKIRKLQKKVSILNDRLDSMKDSCFKVQDIAQNALNNKGINVLIIGDENDKNVIERLSQKVSFEKIEGNLKSNCEETKTLSTFDEKDIELVMEGSGCQDREKVIRRLEKNKGDIVNAIMDLCDEDSFKVDSKKYDEMERNLDDMQRDLEQNFAESLRGKPKSEAELVREFTDILKEQLDKEFIIGYANNRPSISPQFGRVHEDVSPDQREHTDSEGCPEFNRWDIL